MSKVAAYLLMAFLIATASVAQPRCEVTSLAAVFDDPTQYFGRRFCGEVLALGGEVLRLRPPARASLSEGATRMIMGVPEARPNLRIRSVLQHGAAFLYVEGKIDGMRVCWERADRVCTPHLYPLDMHVISFRRRDRLSDPVAAPALAAAVREVALPAQEVRARLRVLVGRASAELNVPDNGAHAIIGAGQVEFVTGAAAGRGYPGAFEHFAPTPSLGANVLLGHTNNGGWSDGVLRWEAKPGVIRDIELLRRGFSVQVTTPDFTATLYQRGGIPRFAFDAGNRQRFDAWGARLLSDGIMLD